MRKTRTIGNFATCKRKDSDLPVKGDLAVTPAQMAKMAANGVGISSQFASSFNDGDTNITWEVPIGQMRGLDIVDFWDAQKDSRLHIKNHIYANEKKYGDSTVKSE